MNETEQTMSNMEQLIATIQGNNEIAKERWIDTKAGWQHYRHDKKKETVSDMIGELLSPAIRDSALTFTVVKNELGIRPWRLEEALERAIVTVNKNNMKNQYNINKQKPKEAVDIAILDESNLRVKGLIELKPWKNANSPAYAFVELLKNYSLSQNNKDIKELILLAPRKYYQHYSNRCKKTIEEFLTTIQQFNEANKNKVKFELKYIELEQKTFIGFVAGLTTQAVWKKVTHTNQFNEVTTIDFADIEFSDELNKSLYYKNWKPIEDTTTWPQK